MDTENHSNASTEIMRLICGLWTSCCLYVAAKLNIADTLVEKPKTAAQIAIETGCNEQSLFRVLRALASVGIFLENSNKEFELTSIGQLLRTGIPGSLNAIVIMNLELHYSAWGNLLHSVKNQGTAFEYVHKLDVWTYYETHPKENRIFNEAMSGLSNSIIENILSAYDFSSFPTIIDVGGGNGALLCGILKMSPHTKGIVYDADEYIGHQAIEFIAENRLQDRCYFESGSFFDKVPGGASAYLIKNVLHDWDDTSSLKILINIKKAMPVGSKLLIIEGVIPENNNKPHINYFMDINMMVMTGGKQRTVEDFQILIEQAGLQLSHVVPLKTPLCSIIEVVKV